MSMTKLIAAARTETTESATTDDVEDVRVYWHMYNGGLSVTLRKRTPRKGQKDYYLLRIENSYMGSGGNVVIDNLSPGLLRSIANALTALAADMPKELDKPTVHERYRVPSVCVSKRIERIQWLESVHSKPTKGLRPHTTKGSLASAAARLAARKTKKAR